MAPGEARRLEDFRQRASEKTANFFVDSLCFGLVETFPQLPRRIGVLREFSEELVAIKLVRFHFGDFRLKTQDVVD